MNGFGNDRRWHSQTSSDRGNHKVIFFGKTGADAWGNKKPGVTDSGCEWVRLNLSLRRFGLVNSLLQSTSGLIPRPLIDLFAVAKQNHVWNRSDVVSRAKPLFFVDVDGQYRQTSSVVSGKLLEFGIDSPAWTAPLGAELDQHQTSRHLTIELIL